MPNIYSVALLSSGAYCVLHSTGGRGWSSVRILNDSRAPFARCVVSCLPALVDLEQLQRDVSRLIFLASGRVRLTQRVVLRVFTLICGVIAGHAICWEYIIRSS